MARYLVIERFAGTIGGRVFDLKPGTVIDDSLHDVAGYLRSGAPLIPYDPAFTDPIEAFQESGQNSMLSQLTALGVAAFNPANTITVGKSGAQSLEIQPALDEAGARVAANGPQTVIIYGGTYDEQIVVPPGVGIRGLGSAEQSVNIRSSASGAVITCPSTAGIVIRDITVTALGASRCIDVPGGVGNFYFFFGSLFIWTGTDQASELIRMSGPGDLVISTCQHVYQESHSTGAPGAHSMIRWTDEPNIRIASCLFQMIVADTTQPSYVLHGDAPTKSPEVLVIASQLLPDVQGDHSVLFLDTNGKVRISGSQIEAAGAAGNTGEAIKTGGNGVEVNSNANHIEVSGFDLNFFTNVDSTDLVSSNADDIDVDQDSTGAGTFVLTSSRTPGVFAAGEVETNIIRSNPDVSGLTPLGHGDLMQVVLDEGGSTGGDFHVLDVSIGTDSGSANLFAVHTTEGVAPICQSLGAPVALGKAWLETSLSVWTDVTTAFNTPGTDVPIVPDDNDMIYIGATALFNGANFQLDTDANIDALLVFEYWNGAAWVPFSVSDATSGFSGSGEIRWTASALTGWATTQVNSEVDGPWYYVRITRTRNNLAIGPIESTVQVIPATETIFGWDKTGNVACNDLAPSGAFTPRVVTDAGMTSTDGVTGEQVFNTADSKFYGCTAGGSPATWAAFH